MPEFDWVKARSACCPATIFEQMRLEVEADIATRNAQLAPDALCTFQILAKGGKFVVSTVTAKGGKHVRHRSVTFSLEDSGVAVHDNDSKFKFTGTLTLNDEGECRLKVKGKELEFWQFRRAALEWLFFETN